MSHLTTLYASGRVTRYHTCDVPAQQIGQHSWGVAMILREVYPKGMEVPGRVYEAALMHDCAEIMTGDLPAPAKWESDQLAKAIARMEERFDAAHGVVNERLTAAEKRIVRWADTFELCLYCDHLWRMGNLYAAHIRERGLAYITDKIGFPTTESKELFDEFFSK